MVLDPSLVSQAQRLELETHDVASRGLDIDRGAMNHPPVDDETSAADVEVELERRAHIPNLAAFNQHATDRDVAEVAVALVVDRDRGENEGSCVSAQLGGLAGRSASAGQA